MSPFHNRIKSLTSPQEVVSPEFRRNLRHVCLAFAARDAQLPPLCSFDFHSFAAFDRSYCNLATPRESLVVGYSLVLNFALCEPLMTTAKELLEQKRKQQRAADKKNCPVDEAEAWVAWQFRPGRHLQLAVEAFDKQLPILVALAETMASSALKVAPLASGLVPHNYFAITAEVTFAFGLVLRHSHPGIASDLTEEFSNLRQSLLDGEGC